MASPRRGSPESRTRDVTPAAPCRLSEAEETLRAIRAGEVDAFLVTREGGANVVSLEGVDSAYRQLVEHMHEGAAILDARGSVLYCNTRFADLLGRPAHLMLWSLLADHVDAADRARVEDALVRAPAEGTTLELLLARASGGPLPVQLSLSPLRVCGQDTIAVVATDLTERKRIEDELRNASLHDALTGLNNRRGFFTLVEQQLKIARRLAQEVLLFFVDLDDLKTINDVWGHRAGDQAIVDTADILRHAFRESDIIARLGGDEFAVLVASATDIDPAGIMARLQGHVDFHNVRAIRPHTLALSVGVVDCGSADDASLDELLQAADAAMYRHKRGKKNAHPPGERGES